MKRFRLDKFKFVYWVIAIATAQHTAWGAATTMAGTKPEDAIGWWAQGILYAIGIDYFLVLIATKIREHKTPLRKSLQFYTPYIVAFIVVAAISTFFQLLFAWKHIADLQPGSGVSSIWQQRLQGLINARLIIAPVALPLIATLYTLGGIGKGGEVAKAQSKRNLGAIQVAKPQSESQPALQSGAVSVAPEVPRLLDENGYKVGAICPGCGDELSNSGWSRHKHKCSAYIEMVAVRNGKPEATHE